MSTGLKMYEEKEEKKAAVICVLCRYLIDKEPESNYVIFGTDGLQNIICIDCLEKIIKHAWKRLMLY